MSFIYNALKKAKREGNVDSAWIPQAVEQPHHAQTVLKLSEEVVKEFSMLKHNVQQAHAEQGTQIIVVTSSVPKEGCSTITYFLSLMLSQSTNSYYHATDEDNEKHSIKGSTKNRKTGVLLIDGNLERPILHQFFNVTPSPGLTEFVFSAHSDNIFMETISADHLSLITSGNANENWHDIWNTGRIKNLFDKLRDQFEYILIDAPPVIGHPETLSLSKLTDGVLFIAKANETRWEVIEEARQQLQGAGVTILGVVLNERKYFIPERIYQKL